MEALPAGGQVQKGESMESKEKVDPVQKVDMVITHISDCILELNNNRSSIDRMPEMAKALAELLQARWYFAQEFPGEGL